MLITLPSQQTTIARLSQTQPSGRNKEKVLSHLEIVKFWGSEKALRRAASRTPPGLLFLSGADMPKMS